jgi:hypothetical protein
MQDDTELKHTFLNRRDWGSYLSALQNAASYPKVLEAVYPKVLLEAVKTGRDWFTQSASQASSWLVGSTHELVGSTHDKFSTG